MNKVTKIINEAITILKDNPIDAGHDLSHHERVNKLALEIAQELNNKDIDKDALQISAMWHDVRLQQNKKSEDYLRKRLDFYKFPTDFSDKVLECIRTHSFDKNPTLIEAQVLYDADKLDALSVERGRKIAKSLLNKEMEGTKKQLYLNVGKAWIKEMRGKLHFEITKKIYDERVKTILKSKEVDELAKKLDIDLTEIKKSLYKELSTKEKLMVSITKHFLSFTKK